MHFETKVALETALKNGFNDLPLVWDGGPGLDSAFVRVSWMGRNDVTATLGRPERRKAGYLYLGVWIPSGTGTQQVEKAFDKLTAIFEGKQFIQGSVAVTIKDISTSPIREDGDGFVGGNLIIRYTAEDL